MSEVLIKHEIYIAYLIGVMTDDCFRLYYLLTDQLTVIEKTKSTIENFEGLIGMITSHRQKARLSTTDHRKVKLRIDFCLL